MNSQFQKRLMAWYRANRRAMPWRDTCDPYRIWLSEVMLQQTRVAAVVDYYRRFLRRFPTVHALARAPQSAVLKHWAGLGYYSRARNLHRAAKEIVSRHNGRFPRTPDAALALPGVGAYTAAAVLSIAYRQPHAVLDGNVARVLARLYAIRGDLRQPQRWRELQSVADQLLPDPGEVFPPLTARSKLRAGKRRPFVRSRRTQGKQAAAIQGAAAPRKSAQAESLCHSPGDWNQAMMELGATICTPRAPRCDACPVARWCRARKLDIAEQLPAARRKRAAEQIHIAAAVLLDPRGRTLLIPPNGAAHNGLFSRMWQFPAVQGARGAGKRLARQLSEHQVKTLTQRAQRGTENGENEQPLIALAPVQHTVTHREIALRPYLFPVAQLPRVAGSRTPRLDRLDSLPISSATRKIARRALEHLAANNVKQRSATE